MRPAFFLALVTSLALVPAPAFAQTFDVRRAVERESARALEAGLRVDVVAPAQPEGPSAVELTTARGRRAASASGLSQQPTPEKNWLGRHPALVGALAGFGTGFLIGYAMGDDGLFYDFNARFNGLVLGGAGAAIGALAGAAATK